MKKLENKVAIVTGSTSGIGKASAILFASEGAKVVVTGRRKELCKEVVAEIKAAGGEAIYVCADLAVEGDMDKIIQATIDAYGKIDILYNNAGVGGHTDFFSSTQKEWDDMVNLNFRAGYILTRKAANYIIENKGNILFTASVAGCAPSAGSSAYSASKAAVIQLAKILAIDLAPHGVRVNSICPGLTYTDILSTIPEDLLTQTAATVPLGYIADPMEQANVALFLVSDDSSNITGQAIVVDGGYTLIH